MSEVTVRGSHNVKEKPLTAISLEGFVDWFVNTSQTKQMRYLKYGLARLAREHPTVEPQQVILDFFAERIHEYRVHVHKIRNGIYDEERQAYERQDRFRVSGLCNENLTPDSPVGDQGRGPQQVDDGTLDDEESADSFAMDEEGLRPSTPAVDILPREKDSPRVADTQSPQPPPPRFSIFGTKI